MKKSNLFLLRRALHYAIEKHAGQTDKEGREYILHPIQTAQLLELIAADDINLICAGYLHDVIEDCDVTYEELMKEFNADIAGLVMEVTKSDYNTFPNLKSLRGITLKFADRLSNLSRTGNLSTELQEQYMEKSKFWQP